MGPQEAFKVSELAVNNALKVETAAVDAVHNVGMPTS